MLNDDEEHSKLKVLRCVVIFKVFETLIVELLNSNVTIEKLIVIVSGRSSVCFCEIDLDSTHRSLWLFELCLELSNRHENVIDVFEVFELTVNRARSVTHDLMDMNRWKLQNLFELLLIDLELREVIDVSVEDERACCVDVLLLLSDRCRPNKYVYEARNHLSMSHLHRVEVIETNKHIWSSLSIVHVFDPEAIEVVLLLNRIELFNLFVLLKHVGRNFIRLFTEVLLSIGLTKQRTDRLHSGFTIDIVGVPYHNVLLVVFDHELDEVYIGVNRYEAQTRLCRDILFELFNNLALHEKKTLWFETRESDCLVIRRFEVHEATSLLNLIKHIVDVVNLLIVTLCELTDSSISTHERSLVVGFNRSEDLRLVRNCQRNLVIIVILEVLNKRQEDQRFTCSDLAFNPHTLRLKCSSVTSLFTLSL